MTSRSDKNASSRNLTRSEYGTSYSSQMPVHW